MELTTRCIARSLPAWLVLGCVGCVEVAGVMGAHVNAYPGIDRPIAELAVLLRASSGPESEYAGIAKVDGKHCGDELQGYPSEVRVLPGEHRIVLQCQRNTEWVGRAEITGRFEAGRFYKMMCYDQGDGTVAADIQDLGIQDPRSPK